MKTIENAVEIVTSHARLLGTENISLLEGSGRVLRSDITSDIDMPPFNKSAMDGYACCGEPQDGSYTIIETIAAGTVPAHELTAGQCSRVMTGAPVPPGTDQVVRFEYASAEDDHMRIITEESRSNICSRGEDIQAGAIVCPSGTLLNPAAIGQLAAVGQTVIPVTCKPRISIITTGSEIVAADTSPGPGQIRNSNAPQLTAQVLEAGGSIVHTLHAQDSPEASRSCFDTALAASDIVLLSGGVSMGLYDLIPDMLRDADINLHFEKLAVKPGKPTVFGTAPDGTFVFGLPGNPVSTLVIFSLLVKPLMLLLSGRHHRPAHRKGRLEEDITVKPSDRTAFVPVCINTDDQVTIPEYHGSAHIGAYIEANGLIRIPSGSKGMVKGSYVPVRPL